MSVPSVKAAAPACNDCATQPATICPSDVLKGLTTLDAIENYLYGQGEVMFKGIDYQCGGFHITHQFAVKDDGSWRAFCFNGSHSGPRKNGIPSCSRPFSTQRMKPSRQES